MVCFAAGKMSSLADNRNLDGSCFAPYEYDSTQEQKRHESTGC